jgi:hypothetical protein
VGENEDLKKQILIMQKQHQQMMDKFKEFEEKLIEKDSSKVAIKKVQVVNEESLEVIRNTFNN